MRKALAIAMLVATLGACKHEPTTPVGGGSGTGSATTAPPAPKQTPYEARRQATCEKIGPKMTACRVEDAKKDVAAGKTSQKQFEEDTKPAILEKSTAEIIAECEKITTTFQLRVFEVCQDKETECEPLAECLTHVNDSPPAK